MERTWKPTAAGILCIVVGAILLIPFVVPGITPIVGGIYALRRRRWGVALAGAIVTLIAPVMILGVAGHIASWPRTVPLADAMLVSSPFGIFGILAIIFVIKGKGEFEAKAPRSALYREESADAHYKRGDAYDETGEYDKAIASYSRAIELDPNHALSYYNRGCAHGEIGEYEKAIADFSKAVELDPNNASAYYNRGLAYHEKGELAKAVGDLEMCIGLCTDPGLIKDVEQALFEIGHSSSEG